MSNTVGTIEELAYAYYEKTSCSYQIAVQRAWETPIEAGYPVNLGYPKSVTYHQQTDRYVMNLVSGSSVRVAEDVAVFMLQHAVGGQPDPKPIVFAKMDGGTVTDVYLMYLSPRN